jgi:hypothetical protein
MTMGKPEVSMTADVLLRRRKFSLTFTSETTAHELWSYLSMVPQSATIEEVWQQDEWKDEYQIKGVPMRLDFHHEEVVRRDK